MTVLTRVQEADTRIIEHNVFEADAVDRMLQFIYRGEYSIDSSTCDALTGTHVQAFQPVLEPEPATNLKFEYQSITFMAQYQSKSFEELRLEDYQQKNDHAPLVDALEQHVQT